MKFAEGGLVTSGRVTESVDYLKVIAEATMSTAAETGKPIEYLKNIAEATTSTAIGVSKPVRAFVSDKDLRSNANERRIRDRNDRI